MNFLNKLFAVIVIIAFVTASCRVTDSPPIQNLGELPCPITALDTDGDCLPNTIDPCINNPDCNNNGFYDNEEPPPPPPPDCEDDDTLPECQGWWDDFRDFVWANQHWFYKGLAAAALVGGLFMLKSYTQDIHVTHMDWDHSYVQFKKISAKNKMVMHAEGTCDYDTDEDGTMDKTTACTVDIQTSLKEFTNWHNESSLVKSVDLYYSYDPTPKQDLQDNEGDENDRVLVKGYDGDGDLKEFISNEWLGIPATPGSNKIHASVRLVGPDANAFLLKLENDDPSIDGYSCFEVSSAAPQGMPEENSYIFSFGDFSEAKWLRVDNSACETAFP